MEEQICYRADRFEVVRLTPKAETGLPSKEIIRHPGAVVILPFVSPGRLCLIRNQRLAVNQTLIELPAGTCQPNEPNDETARRELHEETGYRAGRWTFLGQLLMSPGILDEKMYVYQAEELTADRQHLEADERIEAFEADWSDALSWIASGKINDAKTIAAMMLWQLKRPVN